MKAHTRRTPSIDKLGRVNLINIVPLNLSNLVDIFSLPNHFFKKNYNPPCLAVTWLTSEVPDNALTHQSIPSTKRESEGAKHQHGAVLIAKNYLREEYEITPKSKCSLKIFSHINANLSFVAPITLLKTMPNNPTLQNFHNYLTNYVLLQQRAQTRTVSQPAISCLSQRLRLALTGYHFRRDV